MSSVLEDLFDKAVDAGVKYVGNEAKDYLADDEDGESSGDDDDDGGSDEAGSWIDRGLKSLLGGDKDEDGEKSEDEDDGSDGEDGGGGDWYDKYLGDAAELGARWLGGKAKEWVHDDEQPAPATPQPAPAAPRPAAPTAPTAPATPAADDDPVVGYQTAPGPQVRDHRDHEPYEDDDVVGDRWRDTARDEVDRPDLSIGQLHGGRSDPGDAPAVPDPAVSQLAPEPDPAPAPVQDEFDQQMDTIDQMDDQLDAISGGPE